jgi:phospholipase C
MGLTPFWTPFAILVLTIAFVSPTVIPPVHSAPAAAIVGSFPDPGTGLPGILPNDHIQHVITVVMENHDYDSYFGTYCLVKGPYCTSTGNGIPAGTCVPKDPADPSFGCIVPFNLTAKQFLESDMQHDWVSGPKAYDNGAMDGFYLAESTNITFGHYNQSTIPIYWDMAEEYASSDNFWAANLSYSLPNHWDLLSGQMPAIAYDSYIKTTSDRTTYRAESNGTTSVEDLLNRSNVSWAYYDNALLPETQSFATTGFGTGFDYWNPMAARAESYEPDIDPHFQDRTNFLSAVQNGTLPNVSWVIPTPQDSDHPGYNNSAGEAWVSQLVNTVEASQYWNSTVIFVTWDDYGGWYDHVAPPRILNSLLSFRAPILVISPYAKENYISHTQLDFFSLLRFVEWQFGLGCISLFDCLASVPLDFFNFNQPPRAPIYFGTAWDTTTYPMPLQAEEPLDTSCSTCLQVNWTAWENASTAGAPSVTDWS